MKGWVSAIIVALALGIVAEHFRMRWVIAHNHIDDSHATVSKRFALWRAEAADRGQALLIGDSLTEMASVPSLCGLQVQNAGIAGAQVVDWLPLAPKLIAASKPRIVVIALGTNEAFAKFDGKVWARDYRKLLDAAQGAQVILVPPPEA